METDNAAPGAPEPAQAYDCKTILVLEGLEPVRHRPGMYIGDTTDGSGLNHLVHVLVDNTIEEHIEQRCFRLTVTIHRGGALTVEDDGPGIPVERPPSWKRDVSPLELLFTRLHCGGSVGRSRSRWGIGLACVNALSELLVVEVRRGGWLFQQRYRRGLPETPLSRLGPAEGTGTRITIHPDPLIFASTVFDARRIEDRLRELAFLNPGLLIELIDERRSGSGRARRFYGSGIADWISLLTEGQLAFPAKPLRLRGTQEGVSVDVALRWTRSSTEERLLAFANQDRARDGVHVVGLHVGLAEAIKRAARKVEGASARRPWRAPVLLRGLVVVLDLRGHAVAMGGCCRDTVEGATVKRAVEEVVARELASAIELRPDVLEALLESASLLG